MPCVSLTMLIPAMGSTAPHEVTSPSAGDSPMERSRDLRPASVADAADAAILMLLALVLLLLALLLALLLHFWILMPCLIVSACRHVKGGAVILIESI